MLIVKNLFLLAVFFSAVKIRFFGKAYVYWTESERARRTNRTSGSAQTSRRTYYYKASQNYFNYEVSLHGKGAEIDLLLFTV